MAVRYVGAGPAAAGGVTINQITADWADIFSIRNLRDLGPMDLAVLSDLSTGTGAVAASIGFMQVTSGVTAGGVGLLFGGLNFFRASSGLIVGTINWDLPLEVVFYVGDDRIGAASPQRTTRLKFSLDGSTQHLIDLANEGFAFEFERNNANFQFQTHDGTAIETTDIAKWAADQPGRLRIVHTPGVSVELFLNEVSVATHTTRVPAGTTTVNLLMSANNPTGTAVSLDVMRCVIAQDW